MLQLEFYVVTSNCNGLLIEAKHEEKAKINTLFGEFRERKFPEVLEQNQRYRLLCRGLQRP